MTLAAGDLIMLVMDKGLEVGIASTPSPSVICDCLGICGARAKLCRISYYIIILFGHD